MDPNIRHRKIAWRKRRKCLICTPICMLSGFLRGGGDVPSRGSTGRCIDIFCAGAKSPSALALTRRLTTHTASIRGAPKSLHGSRILDPSPGMHIFVFVVSTCHALVRRVQNCCHLNFRCVALPHMPLAGPKLCSSFIRFCRPEQEAFQACMEKKFVCCSAP